MKYYVVLGGNSEIRVRKLEELLIKERDNISIITTGNGWLYKTQSYPEGLRNMERIKNFVKKEGLSNVENILYLPAKDTISELSLIFRITDEDDEVNIISDDYHLDRIKMISDYANRKVNLIGTGYKGSLKNKISEFLAYKTLQNDFEFFEVNNEDSLYNFAFSMPYNYKNLESNRNYLESFLELKPIKPVNLEHSFYYNLAKNVSKHDNPLHFFANFIKDNIKTYVKRLMR